MAQLSANALATLEDVKQWLKIDSDDDDAHLIDWLNVVSLDCEGYCNRNFVSRTYTSLYKGDGTNILILEQRPVVSITTIKLYTGATALPSTAYYCDKPAGIIYLKYNLFLETFFEIEVVYVAGYAVVDLPADLKKSIVEAVVYRYQKQDKKRIGVASQTFGDQRSDYIQNLYPDEIVQVWNRHRRSLFK